MDTYFITLQLNYHMDTWTLSHSVKLPWYSKLIRYDFFSLEKGHAENIHSSSR